MEDYSTHGTVAFNLRSAPINGCSQTPRERVRRSRPQALSSAKGSIYALREAVDPPPLTPPPACTAERRGGGRPRQRVGGALTPQLRGGPPRSHRGVQCLAESVPQEGRRASAAERDPCPAPGCLLSPRHLPKGHDKPPAPPTPRALSGRLCAPSHKTRLHCPPWPSRHHRKRESQAPGSAAPRPPALSPSLAQLCGIPLAVRRHW